MSHFTVAVITKPGQNYEDLLAPFDEGIEVAPYVNSTKAEIVADTRKKVDELKNDMSSYKEDPKKYLESKTPYWFDGDGSGVLREYWKNLLDLDTKSDEEVYKYYRERYNDESYDEDGNELSTYNPKSKWDWYALGGRWSGMLLTKDGCHVDECDIKDLDASDNEKEYKGAERFWEVAIEGKPLKKYEKKEDFDTWYKKEYYTNRYKNKETYASCQSKVGTFAVLTPDGEWHEPGKMGWFGCSSETDDENIDWWLHYKERYIDPYVNGYEIHIVDCHI